MREVRVEVRNLGPIPSRTKVEMSIAAPETLPDYAVIDGSTVEKDYTCVDCGYHTTDCDDMMEHQQNQRKYHTLWQQLKRWWSMA